VKRKNQNNNLHSRRKYIIWNKKIYNVTRMDTALVSDRETLRDRIHTRQQWEWGVFYGVRAATVAMQSVSKHVPTVYAIFCVVSAEAI
jgi:hypothetical protein